MTWEERSREAREVKNRENRGSFVRRQLWSWNDAWRNIILSLVSTQFVMSFTLYTFVQPPQRNWRMSHKTKVIVKISQGHPSMRVNDKSKQMMQSSTSHNLPKSIEDFFCLFVVLLFEEDSPTVFCEKSTLSFNWTSPVEWISHKKMLLCPNFCRDTLRGTLPSLKSDLILLQRICCALQ